MSKLKFVSSKDVKVITAIKKEEYFNISKQQYREFKHETGERLYTNFSLEDEQLYIDVICKCQCEDEFVIYDAAFDIEGKQLPDLKALYVANKKYIKEFSDAIRAEKQKTVRRKLC